MEGGGITEQPSVMDSGGAPWDGLSGGGDSPSRSVASPRGNETSRCIFLERACS